jgi:hypothetical protein
MEETKANVIRKCEELIRTFNPITHSIDTHIQEQLKKKSKVYLTIVFTVFTIFMTDIIYIVIFMYIVFR